MVGLSQDLRLNCSSTGIQYKKEGQENKRRGKRRGEDGKGRDETRRNRKERKGEERKKVIGIKEIRGNGKGKRNRTEVKTQAEGGQEIKEDRKRKRIR